MMIRRERITRILANGIEAVLMFKMASSVRKAKHANSVSRKVRTVPSDMCAQRRFRSARAFAQSDQNLHGRISDTKDAEFPSCGQ